MFKRDTMKIWNGNSEKGPTIDELEYNGPILILDMIANIEASHA